MVEVGVVIKWHTGTLKGKHSYPYIDVPSIDDKYVLAELSEKQVELDKSRLERGIITISDLAQSESSLAAG